jgi:hypothetical protein
VPKRDDDDDVDIAAEQSSNVANATTTESATSNNASTSDVSSVPGLDVASGGVTESFVTPALHSWALSVVKDGVEMAPVPLGHKGYYVVGRLVGLSFAVWCKLKSARAAYM